MRRRRIDRAWVRSTVDTTLRWSPAQGICQWVSRDDLAVLAYHGVDDPDCFALHAEYLANRTRPISLDEVIDAVRHGRRLHPRSVLITFDDGHRSVLDAGLPVLRTFGLPGVLFMIPSHVDSSTPFWWAAVEEMVAAGGRAVEYPRATGAELVRELKLVSDSRRRRVLAELSSSCRGGSGSMPQLTTADLHELESAGVACENHTWSHPCLDQCGDDVLEREIVLAHDWLKDRLGRPPRAFAYPNGNWDGRAHRLLSDLGYELGFLFDHSLQSLPAPAPLRLSRLRINSGDSLNRLATVLSGLHPAVHHLRGGT